MSPTCRQCGGGVRLLGVGRGTRLYRCRVCAFVSGVPLETADVKARYRDYHARPSAPDPERRYHAWLAHAEARTGLGRLLDVGAGAGGLVRAARQRGWSVDATEVSSSGVERLRETGARVYAGDVQEAGYPDETFDLVVSLEVVEHVPAPGPHLAELWRITRTGGLLLLTTPNFNGLSRRWLGLRWRVVADEHLGYFTPATLRWALRAAGYAEIRLTARSLDVTTWRPRARDQAQVTFDPHQVARLRESVEDARLLRGLKNLLNAGLAVTGLGDSLLAWAQK